MKRLLLYISSLAIMASVWSQTDSLEVDTTDAISERVRFLQPSVVIDYGKLLTSVAGLDEKYEFGLQFLFLDRYYLRGEYGQASLSPENALENGEYTSEGTYFRAGGGYLAPLNAKSRMGIGVNYAQGQFNDQGSYEIVSPSNPDNDFSSSFDRKNLEARWIEFVLTSESKLALRKKEPTAKINQLFTVGFYVRLRVLMSYDRFSPIDVYSIPGFGRTVNDPVPAVNFYLKFHPF